MRWLLVLAACGSAPPAPAPRFDPTTLDIPDPPDLPAVPEGDACETWDERNPTCRHDPKWMCTMGHADCKCPSPPDVENPACWAVMPCPTPPDRRVRACGMHDGQLAKQPVIGRIVGTRVGTGVIVVVGVGSEQGVDRTDRASVLRGDTDEILEPATILRVEPRTTTARVHLTMDQLNANQRIRFDP